MRIEFIFPDKLRPEDLQSTLQDDNRIIAEPPRTIYRTYLDSFDWRLYLDGSLLEDSRDGNSHILVWRSLQGKDRSPRLTLNTAPRFARDL
ncbi:MAG: hypothetical protein OEU62_06360, partial [Gammaproteobacteria bacterium]|nr:hypothetical protein [Gammaproteobacteria bacterium]